MLIINPEDVKAERQEIIEKIRDGAIFVYPTDTIYGIGCNALNPKSVLKVREIKARSTNPFSVIAPNAKWIRENCELSQSAEEWLAKLPGPYTFILPLKNKNAVAKETNPKSGTLGVRIPDHWFSKIISEANVPFISTSVNKSGEDYMTSMEDMDDDIKGSVDVIVYEGAKQSKPSKIVDLTSSAKVIPRFK